MNRRLAIKIYKQIVNDCMLTDAYVCIMSPNRNDSLSEGFQLHLKSFFGKDDRKAIEQIVDAYKLSLKEVSEEIIIYKLKK